MILSMSVLIRLMMASLQSFPSGSFISGCHWLSASSVPVNPFLRFMQSCWISKSSAKIAWFSIFRSLFSFWICLKAWCSGWLVVCA